MTSQQEVEGLAAKLSVYASDDRNLFCRHCGRAHFRHFYSRGVGFACSPPAALRSHLIGTENG